MINCKLISFIILAYNSENDIQDCLNSLLKNFNSREAEIIIWDNNSKDKTREILNFYKRYDFIKIILNDKNYGFAEGNNKAVELALGKYICLLNVDTITDYRVFKELVDYLEKNSRVGIIGPKCFDELGVIQESYGNKPNILKEIRGKIFMSLYLEKIKLIKNLKFKILNKNNILKVDWVGGACVVIRKDLWVKLNGLDKNFFFSNGDMIDFCYRAKKLNFLTVYYPLVSIIHKGSRIVTRDLKTRILGLKKGYFGTLYLFKKNNKKIFYLYFTKIIFILISALKGLMAIFFFIFNKKFKELALSHLYISFYLIKKFFDNDFQKLCQE